MIIINLPPGANYDQKSTNKSFMVRCRITNLVSHPQFKRCADAQFLVEQVFEEQHCQM